MRKTVTAIIINPEKKVLLQLRDNNSNINYPNMWSTPGGFVEEGESEMDALKREMREELELNVEGASLFKKYIHEDLNLEVWAFIYHTKIINEDYIKFNEGQAIKFFSERELKKLKIAFGVDNLLKEFFRDYA